jgi:hypothetical protein
MATSPNGRSPLPALAWAAAATLYGMLFLGAESERALGALLAIAAAAVVLGARSGLVDQIRASIGGNERPSTSPRSRACSPSRSGFTRSISSS